MRFHGGLSRLLSGSMAFAGRLAAPVCAIAAVAVCSGVVLAQSLSPDALQQLQQMQNRGSTSTTVQPGVASSQTILEPTGNAAPLPTSRLEQILSERAGARLQQFGYDQMGSGRSVTLPQVGAVQDSYVLGPGDEIVLSLRGQENNEYRTTVDRDGNVTFPRLAPVSAGGRSFGQFRQELTATIQRAYVSTQGFVSVGRLRQVSVLVSGEVGSPGVRTLTGLSTAVDAILVSGGVKKSGSLRNVRILRGGREIPVDLYGVLSGQGHASSTTLADGDRVIVPTLGKTVAVAGWVRKPGIYELAGGRSSIGVREFINLAGGTEVRGTYRMSVLRIGSDGRGHMTTLSDDRASLNDGDILFVQPAASESNAVATLSGNTPLAGRYAANGGKLSELLKSPGALGSEPYTLFGVISHRDPVTKMRSLIPFTPVAVLKGTEDLTLQSDDIVRVFTASEARRLFTAVQLFRQQRTAEQERAINPQATATTGNSSGSRSDAEFGSLSDNNGNPGTGVTQRQAYTAANTADDNAEGDNLPSGNGQYSGAANGPVLQQGLGQQAYPNQQGYGGQQGYNGQQSYPNQQGYGGQQGYNGQNYPNPAQGYPAPNPGYPNQTYPNPQTYAGQIDALNRTAQPVDNAVPGMALIPTTGEVRRLGELAVQLRVDPLVLTNFLNDRAINVDGAVQGPGLYLVGPDADVQSVLVATGGLSRWADRSNIEVLSTVVDPVAGRSNTQRRTLSLADPQSGNFIIAPRDEVRVSEVYSNAGIGSVSMQGQVRYTGTYQIYRGEHLSDLLQRAGGLTDTAYPYGTVFLRRSAALKEQEAFRRQASEIQDQLLIAMSRRDASSKMAPEAFTSLQGYVNEVRNQKPLGRIVVAADPAVLAANPTADPILEPNDVVYIPPRPYSIAVLGEVLQPSNIPFRSDMSASDYIDAAGGYSRFADTSATVLVYPDGSARRVERSWFKFSSEVVPPGSTIFAVRDLSGIDLHQDIMDFTQIASQLAISAASLAVLSKQ